MILKYVKNCGIHFQNVWRLHLLDWEWLATLLLESLKFLDLVFNTNFVTNKADRSPFQLNSIEVKISKDLSEKCEDIEVPRVAVFNCHSGVSPEIIRILAKYVNIILLRFT